MLRSLLLAALLCAALACASAAQCGWNGYDFSPLSSLELHTQDASHDYSLQPCGRLDHYGCVGVAACRWPRFVEAFEDLAYWPQDGWGVQWEWADPTSKIEGVQYRVYGEVGCRSSSGLRRYESVVQFRCARAQGNLTVRQEGDCAFRFVLDTPLACPAPQPDPQGCQWNGYDFRALMGKDLVGSDGGSTYDYRLRVCDALRDQASVSCTSISSQASACQVQVSPTGASYVIGKWGEPAWSFLDAARPELGVKYSLKGAQSCWATGQPTVWVSHVQFECARETGPLRVAVAPSPSCVQNYTIPTPLACPGAAKLETRLALD